MVYVNKEDSYGMTVYFCFYLTICILTKNIVQTPSTYNQQLPTDNYQLKTNSLIPNLGSFGTIFTNINFLAAL